MDQCSDDRGLVRLFERIGYDRNTCGDLDCTVAAGDGVVLHNGWIDPRFAGRRRSRRTTSRDPGSPGAVMQQVTTVAQAKDGL